MLKKFSVILSTYNQPAWLEKVLWGYACQRGPDFELVIADDGSDPETVRLVERMRRDAGLAMRHVWHEDRGFRKCEIQNRAILASSGAYLIFADGDCIPRSDLVATHARLAAPGRFLSSGAVPVSASVSERIGLEDVRAGRFCDAGWLRRQGWRGGRRRLRLTRSVPLATAFDVLTPTRTSFSGGASSTWRDAMLAVNGFDMRMGYGGEDRAVDHRLRNLGFRGKQIRHRAIAIHLHHDRPYRNDGDLARNDEIIAQIRRRREIRSPCGLSEVQPAKEHIA